MAQESTRNQAIDRHLAGHRSTTPVDPLAGTTYPSRKLDKTLSTIREGLPRGPEKTPGGFGQVWRDR